MVVVDVADNHKNMVDLELQGLGDQEALEVVAFAHLKVCILDSLAMKDIDKLDGSRVEVVDNFLERLDLVRMAAGLVVELYMFESLDVADIGRCSMLVVERCLVACKEFVVAVEALLVVEVPKVAMNMVTAKLMVPQLTGVVVEVDHRLFHLDHLLWVEL